METTITQKDKELRNHENAHTYLNKEIKTEGIFELAESLGIKSGEGSKRLVH